MRTEKEIYDLVLNFAFQDERIRIVKVADSLGYNYPDYDENVTKYLETQKRISNKYLYGNRY